MFDVFLVASFTSCETVTAESLKSFVAIVELSLRSLVVFDTESLESSATSIVESLKSLEIPLVVSEPDFTVAISLVLRSSLDFIALSFAS